MRWTVCVNRFDVRTRAKKPVRWTWTCSRLGSKEDGAGNAKTEALRALKRRISDEVYRRLLQDER
jgi:hypothetical protein